MSNKVTIIGAGMMGAGIGASSLLAGHETVLMDVNEQSVQAGREACILNINQLATAGVVDPAAADAARSLLTTATQLEPAVEGSHLVIEAATENLQLKQRIFKELDAITSPEVLLASNTSGLRITDIALETSHPERIATTHFWFPAHLVLLVEIVLGDKSDPEVGEKLRLILKKWGKSPVVVKRDVPGQMANRILQAVIREAVNIVASGLASPEDVDTAIKAGMALRFPVWGPLEHIDGVGLDLALSVQKGVLPDLNNSGIPNEYLSTLCSEGKLGYKTGSGFYDWKEKNMNQLSACRDTFIIETVKLLKKLEQQNMCS